MVTKLGKGHAGLDRASGGSLRAYACLTVRMTVRAGVDAKGHKGRF